MNAKRFRKRFALLIPTLVIIFFFIGFLFAPNDPMKSNLLARYADPSAEYPFGTDALGRCILSRIIYGGWGWFNLMFFHLQFASLNQNSNS